MWDVFLVGLEEAYIIGLAKIILPLPKYKKGKNKGRQKYSNQVAIETWLSNLRIKDKEAKKHLIEWRHKVLAHIDAGMKGMVNRAYMASLMDEAMDAMAEISKSYTLAIDYRAKLRLMAESSEKDFHKLLEIIKREL